MDSTNEMLARAIHENYRRREFRKEKSSHGRPAMAPWDLLDEGFRESNRQQADDIGRKLDAVACGIAPLYGLTGSRFAFSDDEIERMARLEHSRWMDERRRAGVRYAPGPSTSRSLVKPCSDVEVASQMRSLMPVGASV